MRLGFWTPLPTTTRFESIFDAAAPAMGPGDMDPAYDLASSVARSADASGFHTTLVAERFVGKDLEAWILSAALAAQTRSVEIMTAVHPGIMNPHVVAKMGATMDRISGGRFAVNIVNGWMQQEFDVFGQGSWLPASDDRYQRMDEFIQAIRGLWSEEDFSFHGRFYKFDPITILPRPINVPRIYAASSNDLGQETIAKYGDVWFVSCPGGRVNYEANVEYLRGQVEMMREKAARHGRTIQCGIEASVLCGSDTEAINKEADRMEFLGTQDKMAAITARGLGAGLVGTPELVAERIRRYEEIGLDLLMLKFSPMLPGIEHFGAEVVPLVSEILESRPNQAAGA